MITPDTFYSALNFPRVPEEPHHFLVEDVGALTVDALGDTAQIQLICESPEPRAELVKKARALLALETSSRLYLSASRGGRLCIRLPCGGHADQAHAAAAALERIIALIRTGHAPPAP